MIVNVSLTRRALLSEALKRYSLVTLNRTRLNAQLHQRHSRISALAKRVHRPEKSLMRMFGPKGNPSSHNIFGVIAELAKAEGVNFSLKAKPAQA